jgi:hypothetical protein
VPAGGGATGYKLPEGVPQVTNFCAGCKDRQDKIDALTTQDAKLAEAETAIVELAKTVEQLAEKVGALQRFRERQISVTQYIHDTSSKLDGRIDDLNKRVTLEGEQWRNAIVKRSDEIAALEYPEPTAPRVPSRIGVPCEVWDNGDSEHLRYFNYVDEGGRPKFVVEKQWVGDGGSGVAFDNWREIAPVEGGEG